MNFKLASHISCSVYDMLHLRLLYVSPFNDALTVSYSYREHLWWKRQHGVFSLQGSLSLSLFKSSPSMSFRNRDGGRFREKRLQIEHIMGLLHFLHSGSSLSLFSKPIYLSHFKCKNIWRFHVTRTDLMLSLPS